jgi:hypothetical protein
MINNSDMGFISINRKIIEWEWYSDNNVKSLFIHCLLKANFKDKSWRGQNIKRGTFITSYGNLSNQLNLSIQQIRTALSKLESTKEITIKTTNRNTVVTVVKYDDYQSNKQSNNKQKTNKKQSSNNQITTTNNDNNNNKDNNTFKERKQKFILWFNQQKKKATGKDSNLKVLSTTDDNNLKKLLDGGYEISEFQIAFNNMLKSEWVKQNGMASISHLIRLDNFNKYLTQGENDYKPKMTNLYD